MARKVITNNVDSWKLFSTVSDGVIAEFTSEQALKEYLANETIYDAKLDAIKELMAYPRDWTINDEKMSSNLNNKEMQKYYSWRDKIISIKTTEEYWKAIDDKLEEVIKGK